MPKRMTPRAGDPLLAMLRDVMAQSVRDGDELLLRQYVVLLACNLDREPQTVRGLASAMDVPRPSVSRAVDALEQLGQVLRSDDPVDGRNVFIHATHEGRAAVQRLRARLQRAATRYGVSVSAGRMSQGA